jgi:hypothetical protein
MRKAKHVKLVGDSAFRVVVQNALELIRPGGLAAKQIALMMCVNKETRELMQHTRARAILVARATLLERVPIVAKNGIFDDMVFHANGVFRDFGGVAVLASLPVVIPTTLVCGHSEFATIKNAKVADAVARSAALRGDAIEFSALGQYYAKTNNTRAAVGYYMLACAQGHAQSAVELGETMCPNSNAHVGVRFFTLAASLGSGAGLAKLGKALNHGIGVKKNVMDAFQCYKASAETGDVMGLCGYGQLLFTGKGTPQDASLAVASWLTAVGLPNCSDAVFFNLGLAYMTGRGVTQDRNLARRWFSVALIGGHAQAAKQAIFELDNWYDF